MELLTGILLTIFVVVAAVMAMRQGTHNRKASYEQRRDEVYARYEQRMEEFRDSK